MRLKLMLPMLGIFLLFTTNGIAQPHSINRPSSQPILRLGVIQSLTGIAAEDGSTVVKAVKLATKELNRSNSIKIELIVEDDSSEPANTVSAFKKLETQKVAAIIGATWDFTTNAIIPLSANSRIPLISTSTLPESLNLKAGAGYAHTNAISVKAEASPFRQYLEHLNQDHPRIAYIYAENNWGLTQLKTFQSIALKNGAENIFAFGSTTNDNNEWPSLIGKLKKLSPDLLVLLLNKNDLLAFFRRAQEQHFSVQAFASKNLYDTFEQSSDKKLFESACFTYPAPTNSHNPNFISAFTKEYKESPRIYADFSYDTVYSLHSSFKMLQTNADNWAQIISDSFKSTSEFKPALGKSSLICVKDQQLEVQKP